jgi:alginate O-acetyltransferase complex protein AlgI
LVFSSHLFLFWFLPIALGLYYLSPARARHLVLTLLSYVFYGWENPSFCLLLLFSTAVDYVAGRRIEATGARIATDSGGNPERAPRTRAQRVWLIASLSTNLGLLGFFKYFNFGLESWNGLARAAGFDAAAIETALRVTLPLGISFYTFQSMSYSIDVYRGRVRAIRSFVDFACYVSMFPQLVAGPIVRFAEVADQLQSRRHTLEKFARGVAFLSVGLAKKVLLANPCARLADAAFDAGSSSVFDAWQGVVAYAFQIYFDFSGYSDMAIGLGLMLGFVFPKNFDSPYRASSMTDFWRRWHISFSTWLRDYLYISLGGNRRGPGRTYVNLGVTMLLGGLWHGAAWNFVIWGAYHGALLALERRVGEERLYGWLPRPLRVAVVFVLVLFSWVLFRAVDLTAALDYFARLFGFAHVHAPAALLPALLRAPYLVSTLLAAAVVTWAAPQTWTWTRQLSPARLASAGGLLVLVLAVLAVQDYNPFIYFIF